MQIQHQHFPLTQPNLGVMPMLHPPQYTPPIIPAAYRKGKSGQQLEIIMKSLFSPNSELSFRKNNYGTPYAIYGIEHIFLESREFKDKLIAHVIKVLGLTELSDTAIKHAITLLKDDAKNWPKDKANVTNPNVRVINHGYPNIWYQNQPTEITSLSQYYFPPSDISVLQPKQARWHGSTPLQNHLYINDMRCSFSQDPKTYIHNLQFLLQKTNLGNNLLTHLSMLVHILISQEKLIFEITGSKNSNRETAFETVKELIDPVIDTFKPMPKKATDIIQYGLEEYLISFSTESNQSLSAEQHQTLIQLISNNGVKYDAIKSAKHSAMCSIKRPILLTSTDTKVNDVSLRERTFTSRLPRSENCIEFSEIDPTLIFNARSELLQVAKVIAPAVYDSATVPDYELNTTNHPHLDSFIKIGCELAQIIYRDPRIFLKEFENWASESSEFHFENNDTALVIYEWAKEHTNTSLSLQIKDWKQELLPYAIDQGLDWEKVSFKKIGLEFQKAEDSLERIGICIDSAGRKRVSNWTISVGERIDLPQIPLHLKQRERVRRKL